MSKKAALFLTLFLLCVALPGHVKSLELATITVSGTVTGPGGPLAGMAVYLGSETEHLEVWTNAAGFFSTPLQTSGHVYFNIRPDPALRLAWINYALENITTDLTEDITLVHGHLFDLGVTAGLAQVLEPGWIEVLPLDTQGMESQWHSFNWDDTTHRYYAVLPPDVYWVTVHTAPSGYYPTALGFDLRDGDLVEDLLLNNYHSHPIPYEPPDAALIHFSAIDDLGEADVTGLPGATLPLARVLLVNLKTGHQAHTISESDGSFASRIFAPAGSAVMIKHGPASYRWNDLENGLAEGVNPFPGTIINLPHTHSGTGNQIPFSAVGAIDYSADDPGTTLNYVGAAWALEGVLEPVIVDGKWTQVSDGIYESVLVPGLYFGGHNWTHPALADLDGDGDVDMLVGDETGTLTQYRNDDVISGITTPAGTTTDPVWIRQPGNYAGVNLDGWAFPVMADFDNDNDSDLLVGSGNGSLYIYLNDGTPQSAVWPETPDITLNGGGPAAPALDDLNGDGLLDIVSGHSGGTLDYFRNTGTASAPAWTHQTDAYGGVSEGENLQLAFVDLDGDTDLDMLVGLCGRLLWYRREGTTVSPSWTRVDADPIGYGGGSCSSSPAVGDWSRDSLPDLVIGEHWGQLRFFHNDGASTWSEQVYELPIEMGGDTAPTLADWDGDGDQDMLLGQVWGNVHVYRNNGSPTVPDWHSEGDLLSIPWTNHPHAFPALADINGDGDYDLFIGEGGWQGPGAGGNIHYYENQGTPQDPNWVFVTDQWLGLDVGGWSHPAFVDLNNDGDLDLFVGAEDGTLAYVENTGTITTPTWATPVQPYANLQVGSYAAPSFYDVNDDGSLDMLIGQDNGSLAYVRNTGSPSSPSWELVSTTYPAIDVGYNLSPATADLNNDGQPELLLGTGYGGVQFYQYDGPGDGTWDGFAPGDPFQVEAELTLYGPAIDSGTTIENINMNYAMDLRKLFDEEGNPQVTRNYFMSHLLTPSGFPIQGMSGSAESLPGNMQLSGLHLAGEHAVAGTLTADGEIPHDLPTGIYRPVFSLMFEGVPTNQDWLAANVTAFTYAMEQGALPPIQVETTSQATKPQMIWRLLMDDMVQGTRGAGALEDQGLLEIASQIVTQGAAFSVVPVDEHTGEAITYRLEPFLPAISFTDRRMPTPPLLPLDLPGGEICVEVTKPDGSQVNLGCETPSQSFNRTRTTRLGADLNNGTVQMEDIYSLKTASDRFRITFDQYGHHIVQMTGEVVDIWGNVYDGGGTYDLWVAHPFDIDPGVLPGTPLAVGDRFNPTLQFYPQVEANVEMTLTLYPESNPAQAIVRTYTGQANRFGLFSPDPGAPLSTHGEYRVDLQALYTAVDGIMYHGAMTWGGIVMTPPGQADLVAHGRRGLDSLQYIPNHWFVSSRDLTIPPGSVSHSLNPYYNGDILWSRLIDGEWGGDSLILGASVQDTVGVVQSVIESRSGNSMGEISGPGTFEDRVAAGELPLFISTHSGRPAEIDPGDINQIAYSYRSSQRPGVRVRELVAEDGESGGYWRLNTLYDDQLGVGVLGDQPNDFKFQYVGAVYRDLDTGQNEYLGQGSGWIFIPDDDMTGSRVMPPFSGTGNGGWTTEGGPLLTLKGEDIDMFILPTGIRPGAVLEVGDTFRFAGHLMPTLNSQVEAVVTSPSSTYTVSGQANSIGYFYDSADDFIVTQPGLWSVDVNVWHDGQCSGGATVSPYPSGDVLGSDSGRYWFYVVPEGSPRLSISTPSPGLLPITDEIAPIPVRGSWLKNLNDVSVQYTIAMPGYILDQAQAAIQNKTFEFTFDPETLNQDFPNLDLLSRDGDWGPGLSDTFIIGVLLQGQDNGEDVYWATTITIQGERVYIQQGETAVNIYLPMVLR